MSTTITQDETSPTRGGRHAVHAGHLVMGWAFLCFAGAWALVQADAVSIGDARWLLPVPWLIGGAAGLAVIAARSVRRGPAGAEPDLGALGSHETINDPAIDPATDTRTDTAIDTATDTATDTEEIR